MRVYLPLTPELLADFHAAGTIPATVEKIVAEDESEEAEYAALMSAADASAGIPGPSARRVVLAADVMELAAAVPRGAWAAVHVDTEDDADPEDDLAWYAVQEIPGLIERLLAGR